MRAEGGLERLTRAFGLTAIISGEFEHRCLEVGLDENLSKSVQLAAMTMALNLPG